MNPIFGILNSEPEPVNKEITNRLIDAAQYIKSRQLRTYESDFVFVAATDLLEDTQTKDSIAIDNNWIIIADTSLYKKEELIKNLDLVKNGDNYFNDSELILTAWLKWKEECTSFLYGDFAFVIFNNETKEIFCGRDHIGIKPFFYSIINKSFIFASELRVIHSAYPNQKVTTQYLNETLTTVISGKSIVLPDLSFLNLISSGTKPLIASLNIYLLTP